jgi:hypothetical protein
MNAPDTSRFFVCRAAAFTELGPCIKHRQWRMANPSRMNAAFKDSPVFLVFVVDDEDCLAGVARLTSPFLDEDQCTLQWLRLCELQCDEALSLASNGKELSSSVGHTLMRTISRADEVIVDLSCLPENLPLPVPYT